MKDLYFIKNLRKEISRRSGKNVKADMFYFVKSLLNWILIKVIRITADDYFKLYINRKLDREGYM